MQLALYVFLPVATMALLLGSAIIYGGGAGADVAGGHAAWTGATFPPICGP